MSTLAERALFAGRPYGDAEVGHQPVLDRIDPAVDVQRLAARPGVLHEDVGGYVLHLPHDVQLHQAVPAGALVGQGVQLADMLLVHFADLSARFLSDPSIAREIRRELVDELGRFADFQPVVLEVEQTLDSPAQTASMQSLYERASSLDGLVSMALGKGALLQSERLRGIQREYVGLQRGLQGSVSRMGELEKEIIREVGMMVFR